MLSPWDDLPLHQTAATLDEPASSDPAVYERYYFGFFDTSGESAVGLVMTLHPNKGMLEAALSVSRGGKHETVFARDRLGPGRERLVCGPIELVLSEPMRSLRVLVDDGEGIEADLRFEAVSPAIEESRVTRRRAGRVVQDRTRYVQLGVVEGHVDGLLGRTTLTPETWRGGRDHSWGIWDAPKEHPDDTRETSPSFFWLIGAFPDTAVQAVTHADPDGRPYGEYAALVPTLAAGADVTGPGACQSTRPVRSLEVTYGERSWHASTATVTLGSGDGSSGPDEVLELVSLHEVLPRSVGYSHPDWVSGAVPAKLPETTRELFDLSGLDLFQRVNHRALQFVRMTRKDGAVGYGVVDQSVSAATGATRRRPAAPGGPRAQ